ncbi:MAG: phosphoesterase [Nannocystaceae bacterium]|nr:phosphoesterase [Nannocystaceae bacterium]
MNNNRINPSVSRRNILRGSAAMASALSMGCDSEESDVGFRADADLLANVDHIVVLMMENRSFDHYFGQLTLPTDHENPELRGEGRKRLAYDPNRNPFEDDPMGEMVTGLTGTETNPGVDGEDVGLFHLDRRKKLHHLPHKWEPMHDAFNGGKNDGFVMAHHNANKAETLTAGPEVMGLHKREDVPVLYELADNYTLCDRYFCSVMGPTWPNRFFLHAASSGGRKTNKPRAFLRSIWGRLKDEDFDGINYFSDLPWATAAMFKARGMRTLGSFFKHAEEDRLPAFSVIDPGFFFATSDHPGERLDRDFGGNSAHPEMGPNNNLADILIATIYSALANSPAWERTLFVLTYDESGGFYDHVAPPMAAHDERDEFRQMGFRVPTIVMGPHVRQGFVDHTTLEHSSIASTVSERFGLEHVNKRSELSANFASAIDPALVDNPTSPIVLPRITIDEAELIQKLELVDTQSELGLMADNGETPAELDNRRRHIDEVKSLLRKAHEFDLIDSPRRKR